MMDPPAGSVGSLKLLSIALKFWALSHLNTYEDNEHVGDGRNSQCERSPWWDLVGILNNEKRKEGTGTRWLLAEGRVSSIPYEFEVVLKSCVVTEICFYLQRISAGQVIQ